MIGVRAAPIAALLVALLAAPLFSAKAQPDGASDVAETLRPAVIAYRSGDLPKAEATLRPLAASGNADAIAWLGVVLLDRGETHGTDPRGLASLAPDVRRSGLIEHEGEKVFAEVFGPPPRLVVIGAVDTSEALSEFLW